MAITRNNYVGDGTTVLFSFTFPYLDTADIRVNVNGVDTTAYTLANATTVQFNTPPAAGAKVLIYRRTDTDTPRAFFYPGSAIRSQNLNDNTTQALYSVQEWQDQTAPYFNAQFPDDVSLGGNQINDLEDPTLPQDAATKNYVDTTTWNNTTETIASNEAWIGNNNLVATTGAIDARIDAKIDTALTTDIGGSDGVVVNNDGDGTITVGLGANSIDFDRIKDVDIINTAEQDAGSPAWGDTYIPSAGAVSKRHDVIVQTSQPSGSNWTVGKLWFQNDNNQTLRYWTGSQWSAITSGGTFLTQNRVIWVDAENGSDLNDGHRIINPMKTIKAAVASASPGDVIKVAPGVYREALPINITVSNLSIVGDSNRSTFVHPTPATETQIMFRCNSGTYISGFTFCGLKASGARGSHPIDTNPTYGLPQNQGWVAGFYPGAIIRKSPWIENCTNFADSGIDNSNFDPNNYQGTGGDTSSAPTGGGIVVDGSLPDPASPLRSFVINEFTQVCLDGPGLLVCNNGYAQAVSFFGLFCHYHAKALSGGQINMEVGTTDFGRYGLIADGKSSTAIFTATANGAASASDVTFAVNAPTAGSGWFGQATRPAQNMLVQIGSDIYPILAASPNGTGWNVTISRPDPTDRSINLGLLNGHANGAAVSFFLRSLISTASHTFEYTGAGTDYDALPENGGVPVELNQAINVNDGRVWLTSTDHNGKFKVGDTFEVDQQTGYVTIDPSSIAVNVVSDSSPQLGGDLDVLNRRITTSLGNGDVVIESNGTGDILLKANGTTQVTIDGSTGKVTFNNAVDLPAGSTLPGYVEDTDIGVTVQAYDADTAKTDVAQTFTAAQTFGDNVTLNGQSDLRFADSDSSNWVAFQAPATVSSNVTWTLPAADGTSGQVLSTNGSGTLSWATASGGGAGDKIEEGNTSAEVIDTGSDGRFVVTTEGTERLRVNSSGQVGIGTSTPSCLLSLRQDSASASLGAYPAVQVVNGNAAGFAAYYLNDTGTFAGIETRRDTAHLALLAGGSERARIDSSGRLLVGTNTGRAVEPYGLLTDGAIDTTFEGIGDSTVNTVITVCSNNNTKAGIGPGLYFARTRGTAVGSNAVVQSGDNLGTISFAGADGTDLRTRGAAIFAEVDGTPGANDMPGRLVFSTTADGASSPTERMRITNNGQFLFNCTSQPSSTVKGSAILPNGSAGNYYASGCNVASACAHLEFYNPNGSVGSIQTSSSSTSYLTSSDYRLKENVIPVADGITRLQQLKPSRFNFIADPDKKVDGFIAHEVQTVVPEAIIGEKDAVDDDGNPIYQGIDQSKLVPLLTAALQEAIGRIEQVEATNADLLARVTALEAA